MFLCLIFGFLDSTMDVKNSQTPVGQRWTYEFKEEMRLGPDDHESFIFVGHFLDLEVDHRGHIFVVDGSKQHIMEIDASGSLVRFLGEMGEGPGEFTALRHFRVLNDGSAIAVESTNGKNTISYYDKQLKYLRRENMSLPYALYELEISEDGQRMAGMAVTPGKSGQVNSYGLLNHRMEFLLQVQEYTLPNIKGDFNKPQFWLDFIPSRLHFTAKGEICFNVLDSQGNLYSALAKDYKISKYLREQKKPLTFGREYKPMPQSEAEIQAIVAPIQESLVSQVPFLREMFTPSFLSRAVAKAEFPPVKNPISGLRITEDGHLLVIHKHSFVSGDSSADIFNSEGVFLGSFDHPNDGLRRMIFRHGKAYTFEMDANQERYLVRYAYELVPQR